MNNLDNTLIVAEKEYHKYLLKQKKNKLINFKIITMNELRNSYYFTYNDKAIAYLIEKYKLNIDIARIYLEMMYYVKEIDNNLVKKILDIKKELEENNLLIYNKPFINYLKNKKVIIYNYRYLTKYEDYLINELKDITNIEIYNEELELSNNKYIYQLNTIEEEVTFIATSISKLINDGIDINSIKLANCTGEYPNIVKRIFNWYNIPININDEYLYSTSIANSFINNLDNGLEYAIEYIKNNYNLEDNNIKEIYNQIIDIINNYTWITSTNTLKIFIEDKFKKTIINKKKYLKEIELINNLKYTNKNDYIFLPGFNQSIIPKIYKDEDYFNDKIKISLGLDDTTSLNKLEYNEWLYNIKHTNNLTITTKKTSPTGEFYLSSLNDDLSYEVITPNIDYNYSDIYNQIILTEKLDNLIKYGDKDINLETLYNHYPNIEYGTYNSNYQKIDKEKFQKYINYKLTLSYSNMNTYYQCSYRYYLSNILKLDTFTESFYTIIGNLFHHILSKVVVENINVHDEYYNYISNQDYNFNERELFFLDNLYFELEFIIKTIEKQNTTNSLNKILTEERIEIDKSINNVNILFKGFIDKILLNEDNTIGAIIDYKTGTPNTNLNNTIYGLDLQLPVYIYLLKHKYPHIQIAGFYLQKILNSEITKDNKHTYEYLKEDKLKLQGYSNEDLSILSEFDSSYMDSRVIKGMRTTSKGLGTKKVLNNDKIDKLKNLVDNKIDNAIENILDCNFDINPKRIGKDNIGCKYCNFKDICFMSEKDIVDLKEYKELEFLEE